MFVIRPIKLEDYETFVHFAFQGEEGISSLTKNKELLKKKIESSQRAFAANVERPVHELYLFALENIETGEMGGVCGICSKTGMEAPVYFFQKEKVHRKPLKGIPSFKDVEVLKAVSASEAPTEMCTLYMDPVFRKEGVGRLLSLSRFLFMAAFPQRFDDTVYADMRGFFDENNRCPFYEGVLHHFVKLEREAFFKLMDKELGFLPYVLPDYPIYTQLLPEEVQSCIGKVHPNMELALKMLYDEGFQKTNMIDVLDGGPWIVAQKISIRTIRESSTTSIGAIVTTPLETEEHLLSNERIDFRACLGNFQIASSGKATITDAVAKALEVSKGDTIRYVLPRKKREEG